MTELSPNDQEEFQTDSSAIKEPECDFSPDGQESDTGPEETSEQSAE